MKLCLHICCAPCTTATCNLLKKKFTIEGLYYNPNIYPGDEFSKIKDALQKYCAESKLKVHHPDYNPQDFLKAIEGNTDKPQRCNLCWRLRLSQTARFAKKNNFDCFSTTLLISPYQDNAALKGVGFEVSEEYDIKFYYEDLRPYYKQSRSISKELGLYMQKYCGCEYSFKERKCLPTLQKF